MTNKDLLLEVLDNQKKLANDNLNLAGKLSNFMNDQEKFNERLRFYIDGDIPTKTIGVVENIRNVSERLEKVEENQKITSSKVAGGVVVLTVISGVVSWVISIFK